MGGGKGASSSQTVSIPPEVLARYNAVNARAENVATTPFTPYSTDPEAFVAPLSASQQAGIANINSLQGMATPDVQEGQGYQRQGIDTAQRAQAESRGIDLAALQGISQAQQQGTAYNQAAGKNIFNAMGSAAPYMQQMAGLTQAGLNQGQQYLGGATDLTQRAIQTGQQYANKAEPFYTGALGAAQPLNQAAQQYMQAGAQAVGPGELNYSQYMNPYMTDVVQAQQALQAQENAQQRAAMRGKAIQSGAFGGDRAGIEQANLARQQSLANQATLANLLQSGYGQAQQMAAQQQGVGLSAAQANRAAQQQAAQQAAALGQQGYTQQLGLGQALAALGQQQYGQALGTGAQIGQLGQQGYTQNLGAGAQLGNVGQQLYAQNIGQGQAIQGLGNQQFTQGLQGSQAASGIAQNMYGRGAQTAGLQQAGGMNIANLGLQNQAAQIAAAQAQMAAGQQEQQTEQAGKTALYNQFLQQQGYPFQIAQFLTNTALGTGALSGSTTNATRTGYRGGRMGDGYASGGLVPPDSQGGAVFEPGLYARGGYEDGGTPDYDSMVKQAYAGVGRSGMGNDPSNIDQAGLDYWKGQLQSGAIAPEDFNSKFNQSIQSFVAANPNNPVSQYVSNYQKQAAATAPVSQGLGASSPLATTAPATTVPATTAPAATTPVTTAPATTAPASETAVAPGTNGTGLPPDTTSKGLAAAGSDYASMVDKAYFGIGRGAGTSAAATDSEKQYWINQLKSGAIAPDQFQGTFNTAVQNVVAQDPTSAASKAAIASGAATAPTSKSLGAASPLATTTSAASTETPSSNYEDMVNKAYSGIGRGAGSSAAASDSEKQYWVNQLKSGAIAPDQFQSTFNKAVQDVVAQDPNSAAAKAAIAAGAATTPTTTTTSATTTSTGDNSKYDQIIREAYAGIGRSGIGTNANNIDQAGYNYWLGKLQSGALKPDDFTAQFNKEANAYVAANPNAAVSQVASPQLGYQAVAGVNKDIASAFKDATGKDIDAVSARKYQDMLNSGMSLDQIKYNIGQSQPALLKAGDVGALKGQSLAYDPSKFAPASGVTYNRFGSFSAGNFTPQMPQATGKGAQQPQPYGGYGGGYGNMMGGYGGYGSYGGGYGYGQPSNYGMPNFGSSPQYGGAPDYAGAGLYASNQYNMSQMGGYGMPNYGYGYGMPPQMGGYDQYAQQPPQATGKGAAPSQPQYGYQLPQQPPQATGKGASQAPTASGKGASGMKAGGRAGFADGGRTGYASQGYVDPSETLRSVINSYNPGDPQGLVGRQAAMFANAPGSSAGYVPPTQSMAGQYKMLTPQASILPEQRSSLKEAVSMGTSIASLGDAGGKLYDKLAKNPTTGVVPDSFSEGMSNFGDKFKNFFGMGNAAGGRIGYAAGGIPGLDDLKQGHADIPGGEGLQTPMSKVVEQGTQTPAELKGQMDRMSSGAGGLGGSSGGGLAGAVGTAASIASLGNAAFNAGSWLATKLPLLFLASGGRVGKADGGALVDPSDPQDQAMAEAFDNLLQRYDNNPLLAAAAMDVGTKAVDAAIMKAEQTGGDITDFLPRRTQEYMFALSKAAMGAHDAMSREVRAAGGRTGYVLPGSVDDEPTGLAPAPAPSDAMTMGDVAGGLSPEPTVQVADLKNPDILRALRGVEGANDNPEAKNPNSTAGGLYQYVDKTWQTQAPLAGVDIKQYPTARSAPAEIQHQVADANVSRILEQNKGNIQAVPHMWYAGNVEGKLSPEGLAANKGFTQEQYNQRFFGRFGTGEPEQKPVQTAGLAPQTKTDAGPFERTFGRAMPDAVPTDSSFWVPLIAGLGTMLASDKYRFSQRLGEGLVGGAAAYGKQQEFGLQKEKVASEIMKNTLGVASDRFKPIGGGQWWDTLRGEAISTDEYQNRLKAMPGMAPYMGAPTATTTATTAGAPTATSTTQQTAVSGAAPKPLATQQEGAQLAKPTQAAAETPKNIADVQAIYNQVDAIPEVADAKKTYQDLFKQANDPAIVASGQSTALRTQAAQALSVYNSIRDKYADPAVAELKEKIKLGPEITEGKATEAAAIDNAKNNIKYFDEQAAADQARQQTRVQLGAIRTILENYQSGTFAQEKAQLVGALRAAGINVPASATADKDAFDEFTKEMMRNVFSGVKEIGGQIRVAEMAGLEKASNNPSMEPAANRKVLAQSLGILDAADKRYADEVNAYGEQKNKFNRAKFQLDWRKSPENDPQKFISEAEKNTAVRGATPSDLSEMSAGHVYVIEPSNAFGVAIDKPQKLRFMGVNPETGNPRWQKVQ